MNTTTYETVWDGTRQRGAYLLTEPEVRREPPSPTGTTLARRGLRGRVVETLVHGPATLRALAAALDVDTHAVNGALFVLRKERVVRVRGRAWNPRRFRYEHVYALSGAGR